MEWFESWFDSKYYHILYKNRDHAEAEFFINNLVEFLDLPENAKVLDLACGKGRHSEILAQKGFQTLGVDLAANSIKEANKLATKNLRFSVQDMREPLNENFNAIFNLFTSFGYFKDKTDNIKVIQSIDTMLTQDGVAIIDFMNAHKVVKHLVLNEEKTIDGIVFKINRKVENGIIVKSIAFADGGKSFHFEERVQALELSDFKQFISQSSLKIKSIFGGFDLSDFDEENSDRLILEITKK